MCHVMCNNSCMANGEWRMTRFGSQIESYQTAVQCLVLTTSHGRVKKQPPPMTKWSLYVLLVKSRQVIIAGPSHSILFGYNEGIPTSMAQSPLQRPAKSSSRHLWFELPAQQEPSHPIEAVHLGRGTQVGG